MGLPRAAQLEDWLADLAKRAGDRANRILARKGAGRTVETGAYGSPTVYADKLAEKVIIDELPNAPIPLHLFSEEIGHVRTPGAEWTLVADPIDGTRNAVRRVPFYCVSLAVGRRSLRDIELGVVRSSVTPDLWVARKGKGAWRNGRRIHVRKFDPREVIIAAALDYERQIPIKWHPYVHFRDMGSAALEMCLVADGGIDLFLSTKQYLRIVDIAGASLCVTEAGGHLLDLRKKPLNALYDLKERISMYAVGDRRTLQVIR